MMSYQKLMRRPLPYVLQAITNHCIILPMNGGDFVRTLQRRIEEHDRRIAALEKTLAKEKELRKAAAFLLENELEHLPGRLAPAVEDKPYASLTAADASEVVLLRNNNKPLSVEEITKALLDGGWQTTAQEPKMSINGALVRDGRFERVRTGVYRLKEKPEEQREEPPIEDVPWEEEKIEELALTEQESDEDALPEDIDEEAA
jgi:hypothetical protein